MNIHTGIGFTVDIPVHRIHFVGSSWLVDVMQPHSLHISMRVFIMDIKRLNIPRFTLSKCLFLRKHHLSVVVSVVMEAILLYCQQLLMTLCSAYSSIDDYKPRSATILDPRYSRLKMNQRKQLRL